MKTLILPVPGRSSRFPGMRPKWLLTMPDGKLMLEKHVVWKVAVKGIDDPVPILPHMRQRVV